MVPVRYCLLNELFFNTLLTLLRLLFFILRNDTGIRRGQGNRGRPLGLRADGPNDRLSEKPSRPHDGRARISSMEVIEIK